MDIIAEELVLWLDEPNLGVGLTSRDAALKLKEGIQGVNQRSGLKHVGWIIVSFIEIILRN